MITVNSYLRDSMCRHITGIVVGEGVKDGEPCWIVEWHNCYTPGIITQKVLKASNDLKEVMMLDTPVKLIDGTIDGRQALETELTK